MEILIDFIGENYPWYSCRYIRNFFYNRLFASIEQIHCELSNYYIFEEKTLITKDKCKLEYIIIKKNINTPKKRLMIICGPNGVPYQIFSRNFRFENYLESNMDILCWNYRGYGFSKGTPSYSRLRSDVLELFDEVKKNNNYEKYAVHGISIGVIPCCHLASHRKEIELLICDRNFGRIDYRSRKKRFEEAYQFGTNSGKNNSRWEGNYNSCRRNKTRRCNSYFARRSNSR
jgi:hypothetical protein